MGGARGQIAARPVAGDGEEPGREPVAVLEGAQRPESADEGFLGHVLGLVGVELGEARRQPGHRRPVAAVELLRRRLAAKAAGQGAPDQHGILHVPVEQGQEGGAGFARDGRSPKGGALVANCRFV